MRHLLPCVVLVACGACGPQAPSSAFPPIEVPAGYEPRPGQVYRAARGRPVPAGIRVRIDAGGRLRILVGDRWRTASLEGLGTHLRNSKERYEAEQGACAWDRDAQGFSRASRLVVALEVQADTPWLHLGWIMTVCMEQHFDKLQVRVGDCGLNLFLPWGGAIEWVEPLPHIRTEVLADLSEAGTVRYEVDGRSVEDLAGVVVEFRKALQSAQEAGKADILVCVLSVPRDLPAGRVLELIGASLDAGIPRFDLGLAVPPPADREVEVLRSAR